MVTTKNQAAGTARNAWRLETPGAAGWERAPRPGGAKYLMVSADCHTTEGPDYLDDIEPQYRDRIPRVHVDDEGSVWFLCEGNKPQLVARGGGGGGEHQSKKVAEPEDDRRMASGASVEQRLADLTAEGIDAELIFPNKGLLCWATPDPVFQMAMCRAYNRWLLRTFQGHMDRLVPMALLGGATVDEAVEEVAWAAEHGFRGVALPSQPVYGAAHAEDLLYNDETFEPLWSALEQLGLVITFHVSTGRDPRAASGPGGAIINFVSHSMATTLDPLVTLIASGVFERHPGLRAGTVEAGVGWVPWFLEAIDRAHRAHHMWVRPTLPEPPSAYYRRNCFSTFIEDHAGMKLVEEYDLVDNFCWSNDYPHHEGSWPHSSAAIERQMGHLREETRAKLLGENAARIFGLRLGAQQ